LPRQFGSPNRRGFYHLHHSAAPQVGGLAVLNHGPAGPDGGVDPTGLEPPAMDSPRPVLGLGWPGAEPLRWAITAVDPPWGLQLERVS